MISPKIEIKGNLSKDEKKRLSVAKDDRNQYKFAKVGLRGGDGDDDCTTKLARWETMEKSGGNTLNLCQPFLMNCKTQQFHFFCLIHFKRAQ